MRPRALMLNPEPYRGRNIDRLLAFVRTLDSEKRYEVKIQEYRATRAIAQNRFLWGVAYKILEAETGQPKEDWHEFFLGKFFGEEEVQILGEKTTRPIRRSSALKVDEFADYVDFVISTVADHGIIIPEPDQGLLVGRRG